MSEEQKSYTNQVIDRLKKVRGKLPKADDRGTIQDAINLLREMKQTKDNLEAHVKHMHSLLPATDVDGGLNRNEQLARVCAGSHRSTLRRR